MEGSIRPQLADRPPEHRRADGKAECLCQHDGDEENRDCGFIAKLATRFHLRNPGAKQLRSVLSFKLSGRKGSNLSVDVIKMAG